MLLAVKGIIVCVIGVLFVAILSDLFKPNL